MFTTESSRHCSQRGKSDEKEKLSFDNIKVNMNVSLVSSWVVLSKRTLTAQSVSIAVSDAPSRCSTWRTGSFLSLQNAQVMKVGIKGSLSYYKSTHPGVNESGNVFIGIFVAHNTVEKRRFIRINLKARR